MSSENDEPIKRIVLLELNEADSQPYSVNVGKEISPLDHQMTILLLQALAHGPKCFHC